MRAFLLGLREPDATFDDDGAAREKMPVNGTKRTSRSDVAKSACGGTADNKCSWRTGVNLASTIIVHDCRVPKLSQRWPRLSPQLQAGPFFGQPIGVPKSHLNPAATWLPADRGVITGSYPWTASPRYAPLVGRSGKLTNGAAIAGRPASVSARATVRALGCCCIRRAVALERNRAQLARGSCALVLSGQSTGGLGDGNGRIRTLITYLADCSNEHH